MLRDLIKRMPKKRLGSRRARERHLRRVGHHRELSSGLQFESLEQRALLAGLTVAGIDGITNVIEGGTLTFEVKLDGAVPDAFTVDVTLAEVTATGGVAPLVYPQDYDNVVAQLYFSGTAGETQQFTVATLDDAVVELDETFSISLTASDVLIDGSATATGTIIDNDHATLSVGNATIVEGDAGTKMLSFPVTLDAAVDVDVSVDYTTQDGTASAADGDYVAVTTPATLTISAGDTSGTINISVNGDTTVELSETLSVVLDNPQCDGCAVTLTLTDWSQLGQSIYGEQFWNDRFGESVSVSGDGDTIVVGAPGASSIADRNGRARVYHFDDAEWTQLGEDINGEFQQDYSGESVSLSGDGNTVAIGARYNDGTGENSGHVRVFRFDGTNWLQLGQDIAGEAVSDQSGGSVSLSGDGHTLASGTPNNNDNGFGSGRVRVYRLGATGTITDDDSLVVEFNQSTEMDAESSGERLPQLLVTGTIQAGHSVTIDVAVVGGKATGGGVDFNDPMTVTVPAGTYNSTTFSIMGLSIAPDTLIESGETIELGRLTGSQIEVGDANGDGMIQATTQYTITDDDLQRVQTSVELSDASRLTVTDIFPGGKDDQLELTIVSNNLVISDSNNMLGDFTDNTTGAEVSVPLASLQRIELNLAGGDDRLSIDFSSAPQGLNLSVSINGGDGHDTLIFSGATQFGSGELKTNDGVEDIFVNRRVTMQSGTIALNAAQSLEVNAGIRIGMGTLQLTAGKDVFGNCSLIRVGDADVHLVSGTGIAGVRIQTTADVSLNGGSGGIVGCTGAVAVRAQTLTLVTGSSVGTAFLRARRITDVEPFRTSVDSIQGTVGGMGVFLLNDRPLIDDVVLVDAPPLGIRHVCPGPACDLSIDEGLPLHNAVNQLDVNDDGSVSPIDALAVVNFLNAAGGGVQSEGFSRNQTRLYVDVNGDRAASALDVLIIVNYLNRRTAVHPEAEAVGGKLDLSASEPGEQFFGSHPCRRVSPRLAAGLGETGLHCSLREGTLFRGAEGDNASSHRPARLRQAMPEDDETEQPWELLLDELAEDALSSRIV